MKKKSQEASISQFDVAIESGKFQLPEEYALPRLSFHQVVNLFVHLWNKFTNAGIRDPGWVRVWKGLGFDIELTAKELDVSVSAVKQRIHRLKKSLGFASA